MSSYLCVDGASPSFVKALELLVHSHVADIRHHKPFLTPEPVKSGLRLGNSTTLKVTKTTGGWDLPLAGPGRRSDQIEVIQLGLSARSARSEQKEPELCMPPQPSGQEWVASPSASENSYHLMVSPHSKHYESHSGRSPALSRSKSALKHKDADDRAHNGVDAVKDLDGASENAEHKGHSLNGVHHEHSTGGHHGRRRSQMADRLRTLSFCDTVEDHHGRRVTITTELDHNDDHDHDHKDPGRKSLRERLRLSSWFPRQDSHIDHVVEGSFKDHMRHIVNSKAFEFFSSSVILINCFTMGLEAEQAVKGPANTWSEKAILGLEHVFTAFFTMEILIKFAGYGCQAFTPSFPDGKWNIVDIFLVLVTGVLFTWILPVLSAIFSFDNDSGFVNTLTIFRSIRLLRLVRVLQRLPQFREAWILLRGLLNSTRVLIFTVLVIFFVTYLFAIIGMVTISKDLVSQRAEAERAGDEQRFDDLDALVKLVGGLDQFMYMLVQLLTLDSWSNMVRRFLKEQSWSWFYFYAYISVAVFVLMNLVTAIIVDNALSSFKMGEEEALNQRDLEKSEELKRLEHLFDLMDSDKNGFLNWDEFKAAFHDPETKKKWRLLDFEPEDCCELFGMLENGNGEIATSEFFAGLVKMKGVAQSKDIFRIQKDLEAIQNALENELDEEVN